MNKEDQVESGIHPDQEHTSQSIAEMLTDSSIDRVLAIDLNWKLIAWNKTSENATGLRKADVMGKRILDIFADIRKDGLYMQSLHAAFKGLKGFLPADASLPHRRYYEHHIIPLRQGDTIIGVMVILHDVSHRIKAEQLLQQLNASLQKKFREAETAASELSTFTIITSSNIKEPVRHIYTGLEFLLKSEKEKLTDSGKASLRRMQSSLNRMNLLLNDMVSFSQLSNPEQPIAKLEVTSIIAQAQAKLERKILESGAKIHVDDSLPAVNGYADLVQRLFYELLDNAIKFQRPGNVPVVTVTGDMAHRPDASVNALEPSTFVRISVTDNGIGIPQHELTRIFSLFVKLHNNEYRGSGMGLAIARKISEMHDGFIQVEHNPDRGTTFHCYFPGQ